MKRLLSANTSEIEAMSGADLKQSILASEGRIICAESVVNAGPQVGELTNGEVAVAYGADLLLLNGFDCFEPFIGGLPETVADLGPDSSPVLRLKKLIGRPVGINLEPVDPHAAGMEQLLTIAEGRMSSVKTFQEAEKLGVDFICLTGNPGTGVTSQEIAKAVRVAKEHFSGLIIAGKMHSAGVNEPVAAPEAIEAYIEAGADVILLPAVGTVPGFTDEEMRAAVQVAKNNNALTMSAIGTSQESADADTIKQIALRNKINGVDIQHIGDAGYGGLAPAENIYTMSLAIRGLRHTLNRVSRSILR